MRDIFRIESFHKGLLFLCLNPLNSIFRNKFSITGILYCMLKRYFSKIQTMLSEITRKAKMKLLAYRMSMN